MRKNPAKTSRTDVEWIDGIPYCETCNVYVSANNECGATCMQTELARVVRYLRREADTTSLRDGAAEHLRLMASALEGGDHRR